MARLPSCRNAQRMIDVDEFPPPLYPSKTLSKHKPPPALGRSVGHPPLPSAKTLPRNPSVSQAVSGNLHKRRRQQQLFRTGIVVQLSGLLLFIALSSKQIPFRS